MKKTPLFVLFIALLCNSLSQTAYAHALWIEASQVGKKNGTQTVKVFYGEYEHGTRDLVKDWYADVKELELWVQHPSGQSTKLETSVAADHLSASFTPEQEGLYLFHTTHAASELGGQTKYVFSASLPIVVGKSDRMTANPKEINLLAFVAPSENRVKQTVDIVVMDEGNALADAAVTVISAEGWAKTFKTDASGKVSFQPLWEGMYVVETSKYSPEEGIWNDKPHTHVWHGATTVFTVN
ncbi:DUF4198 domain-containing protein [Sphingobacterium gobiense]|uniref:Nickel transport complex protein, NikM subunit, transmembrane n=1 Tax=Sphingobacterium gobiense TaxID=1382456 RepID=A0A2S9JUR2_9SPHI|nr:DUF4198 domain-containing protein [Sphingobacterium gobiense]PRD56998.1 nickel transport complex protein, NikM subunit, transmembrane [Sphingobacterium gobiense]